METPLAQHDWAHITTAGDRRKYGHHRIRKCRNCGALERYDPTTLKRVYQAGPLILDKPIQCDAWHKDLAREIGLEYLPYKLAGQFTEAEFERAKIKKPELDVETAKREVEIRQGGVE